MYYSNEPDNTKTELENRKITENKLPYPSAKYFCNEITYSPIMHFGVMWMIGIIGSLIGRLNNPTARVISLIVSIIAFSWLILYYIVFLKVRKNTFKKADQNADYKKICEFIDENYNLDKGVNTLNSEIHPRLILRDDKEYIKILKRPPWKIVFLAVYILLFICDTLLAKHSYNTQIAQLNSSKYESETSGLTSTNWNSEKEINSENENYTAQEESIHNIANDSEMSVFDSSADKTSFDDVISSDKNAFYGVWCGASKNESSLEKISTELANQGFDPIIVYSEHWSDLEGLNMYVLSAGRYPTEKEANIAISSVKPIVSNAFVVYSGEYVENKLGSEDTIAEIDCYPIDGYESAEYWILFKGEMETRYITEDDLIGMTPIELTYLRNSIYAWHGYVFESRELLDYFYQYDNYIPKQDFSYDSFSEIEKYNVELIRSYQNQNELMYKPK